MGDGERGRLRLLGLDKLHSVASTLSSTECSYDPGEVAQLFSDLVRVETRLYNAINDHLRARHGIGAGQFEFLNYIKQNPNCRVGDLSTFFAVGIGATSKAIDRSAALGYLERKPNPHDRRSSLLELTAAGEALVSAAEQSFTDKLGELTAAEWTAPHRQALGAALGPLRLRLERDRIGHPAG